MGRDKAVRSAFVATELLASTASPGLLSCLIRPAASSIPPLVEDVFHPTSPPLPSPTTVPLSLSTSPDWLMSSLSAPSLTPSQAENNIAATIFEAAHGTPLMECLSEGHQRYVAEQGAIEFNEFLVLCSNATAGIRPAPTSAALPPMLRPSLSFAATRSYSTQAQGPAQLALTCLTEAGKSFGFKASQICNVLSKYAKTATGLEQSKPKVVATSDPVILKAIREEAKLAIADQDRVPDDSDSSAIQFREIESVAEFNHIVDAFKKDPRVQHVVIVNINTNGHFPQLGFDGRFTSDKSNASIILGDSTSYRDGSQQLEGDPVTRPLATGHRIAAMQRIAVAIGHDKEVLQTFHMGVTSTGTTVLISAKGGKSYIPGANSHGKTALSEARFDEDGLLKLTVHCHATGSADVVADSLGRRLLRTRTKMIALTAEQMDDYKASMDAYFEAHPEHRNNRCEFYQADCPSRKFVTEPERFAEACLLVTASPVAVYAQEIFADLEAQTARIVMFDIIKSYPMVGSGTTVVIDSKGKDPVAIATSMQQIISVSDITRPAESVTEQLCHFACHLKPMFLMLPSRAVRFSADGKRCTDAIASPQLSRMQMSTLDFIRAMDQDSPDRRALFCVYMNTVFGSYITSILPQSHVLFETARASGPDALRDVDKLIRQQMSHKFANDYPEEFCAYFIMQTEKLLLTAINRMMRKPKLIDDYIRRNFSDCSFESRYLKRDLEHIIADINTGERKNISANKIILLLQFLEDTMDHGSGGELRKHVQPVLDSFDEEFLKHFDTAKKSLALRGDTETLEMIEKHRTLGGLSRYLSSKSIKRWISKAEAIDSDSKSSRLITDRTSVIGLFTKPRSAIGLGNDKPIDRSSEPREVTP